MAGVSDRLRARIDRDFPDPGSADEVARLVAGASDGERIQAAIVLLAGGDLDRLHAAIRLTAQDWRDTLAPASNTKTGRVASTPSSARSASPSVPTST